MFRRARDRGVATPAFGGRVTSSKQGSIMRISNMMAIVKSALIGAAAGAAALAVLGFNWGGWVTGGTAERIADRKASAAVVLALAPICVDKFRHQSDAGARFVSFQELSSYDRTGFIEKGGWAATLGGEQDNLAIIHACAASLTRLTAADFG
jgi:hypothetical protein